MKAQLVLQFDGASISDFDRLVSFEELLRQQLGGRAVVDGHDFGSGEFNIFILTNDARLTFRLAAEIARTQGLFDAIRAGYRAIDADDFSVLWPPESGNFSIR